ncbi:MAG: TerC family protein [Candidatus Dasytiphilus stammeri]
MFTWIIVPSTWISLITLMSVEIILGIDNIILISFQISHLSRHQQKTALMFGLGVSMVIRIILLSIASWMLKFTHPIFTLFFHNFSFRELIFLLGGIFLLWKSFKELHNTILLNFNSSESGFVSRKTDLFSLGKVVGQIIVLDILFSMDSVLTAVSISTNQTVMFIALIFSAIILFFFSRKIAKFMHDNIFIKILTLAFIGLLGIVLMLEGIFIHIPRGYLYASLCFALLVEGLNFLYRKNHVQ